MGESVPLTSSASEAFDALCRGWGDVGIEIETAIDTFLKSFDTADRAIRFFFGGYVEWLLAAALFHLKILALPAGHNQGDFDLQSVAESIDGQAKSLWSVKASSTKDQKRVNLKNFHGGSEFTMHPTVFVDPCLGGLVLIDPELHPGIMEHVHIKGDAAVLDTRVVKEHAGEHPDCFIAARLPVKETRPGKPNPPAGFSQFQEIVGGDSLHYPHLGSLLASAKSSGTGHVDEIERLVSLRDDGKLTQEEFEKSLRKVLE